MARDKPAEILEVRLYMLAHMPTLVYSGPPGGVRVWRELPHQAEGIYHFFDTEGDPVYVGKTCNPSQRFLKHRERPWWRGVSLLNHYVVTCYDHPNLPCDRTMLERTAFQWESHAIEHLQPRENIVGVRI